MGKTRKYAERDVEAESERRPLPPPDPRKFKQKEAYWKDLIGRVGRSDRHGGVYYIGNYDHDGNLLSGEELMARDARHARDDDDDNPLLRDSDD